MLGVTGSGNFTVDKLKKPVYNNWKLVRTLWPKKCLVTGKTIPMYSKAFYHKAPAYDPWAKDAWVARDEFIFAKLRGEL